MQEFFLTIIIILSIMFCIHACITICSGSWRRRSKYIFTYLSITVLLYQCSTLFAFYCPPEYFEGFVDIKICMALLIKAAFIYFIAEFIRNKILSRIFLILNLLSIGLIILYFIYPPFKASIVTIVDSNTAVYGVGSQIYAVISNVIFFFTGIAFIVSYKPFRQIRRNYIFLLIVILMNMFILNLFIFEVNDVLHEQTHVLILFVYIAFFSMYTPFTDKNDRLMSLVNIMSGIGESVIIIDNQGKIVFFHNGFDDIDISERIEEIDSIIIEKSGIEEYDMHIGKTDPEVYCHGEIELMEHKRVKLHYILSFLYFKEKYMGRIVVLRDITEYTSLLEELNKKNILLKEAVERQKEYVKAAHRLSSEEERSRILETVNAIAGEFLKNVKQRVYKLETEVLAEGAAMKDWIRLENDQMLELTKKTIAEVRQTVKRLHIIGNQEE